MDPLEALQSGIAKKRNLERKNGKVYIGSHVFPDKTYTCMKKPNAGDYHESTKETSYYTLDSIFYFWQVFSKNNDMDQGDYALQCVDNGVEPVSFQQKHALLHYLKGKEKTCTYFDTSVPFRYVKPEFDASSGTTAPSKDGTVASGNIKTIQNYKRMRAILGQEKIYETRSKTIALDGKSEFVEALDLIRHEDRSSRANEDWKSHMNMNVHFNPEAGFLTQSSGREQKSNTKEAIIIVAPAAGNNVITMYNVEEFLTNGRYILSDDIKKKNPLKPHDIVIEHVINNKTIKFRLSDNPLSFTQADWNNVVCIISGSQTWQFRGWRYRDPAVLFNNYLGIFMWYSEMPLPAVVKGYNVQKVYINRDIRNMDNIACVQFWDLVEKSIKTKKANLLN